MKNICTLILILASGFSLNGQTMKWIPLPKGSSTGLCVSSAPSKSTLQCYSLEYIPNVSGVLTSYTTAFLVSCTSKGSAIDKNESCYMSPKVSVQDGCSQVGKVMMISAGNSGTAINSYIKAGQPIYLHQVCFDIPEGESISVEKDPTLNFTTSVDLAIGTAVTEFPAYVTQSILHPKYDVVRPTEWLDIKTVPAGDHKTQIDWSVTSDRSISHFAIEHSLDGVNFKPIGEVKADANGSGIHVYQFTHAKASTGKNYYRIQLIHAQSDFEFSPVRTVSFGDQPFTVRLSPNPATEYILVEVSGQKQDYEIRLFDANGKLLHEQTPDMKTLQTKLKVDGLGAGVYTVQVKCGDEFFSDKVAVTK
jgi:hypothetical protein